ncbi:MAG: class I tRNA ligase family protein, partial [Pseudomonadota bacterium]
VMLHPFMPFITEELWGHLGEMGPEREAMLIASRWPELEGLHDRAAAGEIAWVIDLINEIRSVRSQMNVPAGAKLTLEMVGVAKQTRQRAEYHEETLKRLANLDTTLRVKKASSGALQLVVAGETFALPIGDVIDLDAERARLGKEIAKVESEIDKLEKKLSNEQFLAKAADHVIAEQRSRRETAVGRCDGLKAALERLDLVQ